MSKEDSFSKIVDSLMEEAQKDGIISSNELELIKQAEIDLDSYNLVLLDALLDGHISDEEKDMLDTLKETILERAETIASLDGIVEDDERQILQKLGKLLSRHIRSE